MPVTRRTRVESVDDRDLLEGSGVPDTQFSSTLQEGQDGYNSPGAATNAFSKEEEEGREDTQPI
jgi:hypothetical protein